MIAGHAISLADTAAAMNPASGIAVSPDVTRHGKSAGLADCVVIQHVACELGQLIGISSTTIQMLLFEIDAADLHVALAEPGGWQALVQYACNRMGYACPVLAVTVH